MDIRKQEDHGFSSTALDLWNKIYPALEIIATLGGCIGFIEYIKNIFKKKIPKPHSFADYIYRKDKWNHIILAEELNIDKDDAKTILKLFGYKWDNSEKLYVISEESKKEKIQNINNVSIFGE